MYRLPIIFILSISLFTLPSCYERQEGCIDLNAVNFNPIADDACCCNYPTLSFQLQHRYGADSIRFFADSTYFLNSGVPFKVLSLELLADELFLIDGEGNIVRVEEKIEFEDNKGESCPCIDDVFLINPRNLSTSPGTISKPGTYESIRFSSGLSGKWSGTMPSDYPSGHPLVVESRYDVENEKYHYLQTTLVFPDTGDTVRLNSTTFRQQLDFEGPFEFTRAQNTTLRLLIDYQIWFNGIENVISDPQLMEQLLSQNFINALNLSQ